MENDKAKDAESKGEIKESKELALHYMQTLVDVARESFLILDAELRVVSANPTFYESFHVRAEETIDQLLYELGNGQWNIVELKKLLEEILPEKKVVKDYQVGHVFETIGAKTMLLNARQIDSVQLIILAIEDITTRVDLETKIAQHSSALEAEVAKRTRELALQITELETMNRSMIGRELKMVGLKEEITELKKKVASHTEVS